MRRILHLIETGGPGGAENVLIRLACASVGRGDTVEVGLIRDGWLAQTLRSKGIDPWLLPEPGRLDLAWNRMLAERVRAAGITAIHAHEFTMNCAAMGVSRRAGIPFVATVHGCNYWPDKLRRRLAYRMVAARGSMVAVSADTRDFLARTLHIARERIHMVANGLDLQDYHPDLVARRRVRQELGIADDQLLIGAIGNLYPVKGHRYLIDALSQLPDVALMIAGRGKEQAALEAQITALGLNSRVHLLGFRQDIPDLLQAMDIFAMPSDSEGLPLSILEAMAARQPVVASAVGGIPEAVRDGEAGLLIKAGDVAALTKALRKLIADQSLREQMGEAGHQAVGARYSLSAMLDAYEPMYLN